MAPASSRMTQRKRRPPCGARPTSAPAASSSSSLSLLRTRSRRLVTCAALEAVQATKREARQTRARAPRFRRQTSSCDSSSCFSATLSFCFAALSSSMAFSSSPSAGLLRYSLQAAWSFALVMEPTSSLPMIFNNLVTPGVFLASFLSGEIFVSCRSTKPRFSSLPSASFFGFRCFLASATASSQSSRSCCTLARTASACATTLSRARRWGIM
mmetsp:Transcript_40883/g.129903  ORF Transcript_40883/g.129903 Transcript_40883/m.129903 type:complete len:213 (-) Transcript_40883:246-884(-)